MGRRCRITFLYIPSRNVIIHRLYEIVNILLPAIISEGGIPSEVGKKKNSSENKKWGENFFTGQIDKKRKSPTSGIVLACSRDNFPLVPSREDSYFTVLRYVIPRLTNTLPVLDAADKE